MQITVDKNDDYTVAAIVGELNIKHRDDAARTLIEIIEQPDVNLAVDLSGVKYLDSAGIGCLVDLFARANVQGSRMVLVAPSLFVSGVLENTRLDRWFIICKNIEEAAAHFQQ